MSVKMSTAAGRVLPVWAGRGVRPALILPVVVSAQFMVVIDDTVVNVALPSIQRSLGFTGASLSWVVNAYLVAFGGFLLLGGKAADLVGRRRMFLCGLALFTAASIACGLASSGDALVICRGLQGLGGGLLSPAALAILTSTFQRADERRRALGVWGGLLGLGGTFGVLLGGVVTDTIGWRWVFYINAPIGVLVAVACLSLIPADRASSTRRLDLPGAVLATVGMLVLVRTAVQTPEEGWFSAPTLVGLVCAGLLLGAFWWWETRTSTPLLPIRRLGGRITLVANLIAVIVASALFAMFFFVTLYMQLVHQWSPLRTGLSWAPFGITTAGATTLAARLVARVGSRALAFTGALFAAGGQLLLLRTTVTGGYAEILPALLLVGVGIGLMLVPISISALFAIGEHDHGIGGALLTTAQQTGGAIGLAVLVSVSTNHLENALTRGVVPSVASVDAFHLAFAISGGLMLVAGLLVPLLPRLRRKVDLTEIGGI